MTEQQQRPARRPTQTVEFLARRAHALTVPCSYCRAHVGEPCRNKDAADRRFESMPAHPRREVDATRNRERTDS